MINPFNVSERNIKVSNLRGDHFAGSVFCKKLVKHPGDTHYGWLSCVEVVEGEYPLPDSDTLEWDDRIYYSELHIRGIYGIDELEVQDDSEQ